VMADLVGTLDVATGRERLLCLGADAQVLPSLGAIAIVEGKKVSVIDASDGRRIREPVEVPGWIEPESRLLAAIDADHVLYVGSPTTGTEQRFRMVEAGISRAMPSIKLADLRSGAFVTVVPYFEPSRTAYTTVETTGP